MILPSDQMYAFQKACALLQEWLHKNVHPHTTVVLDSETAQLLEGVCTCQSGLQAKDDAIYAYKKVALDKLGEVASETVVMPLRECLYVCPSCGYKQITETIGTTDKVLCKKCGVPTVLKEVQNV